MQNTALTTQHALTNAGKVTRFTKAISGGAALKWL